MIFYILNKTNMANATFPTTATSNEYEHCPQPKANDTFAAKAAPTDLGYG